MLIKSVLLVDDENLFHLVFEECCYLLDITLNLQVVTTATETESMFSEWKENPNKTPCCIFVDLDLEKDSISGIELASKILAQNENIMVGIIANELNSEWVEKAKNAKAQFFMVKSHNIEPRLEQFKKDYNDLKENKNSFKIYNQ